MSANPFTQLVFDLFIISAIIISAYTVNFYYLAFLSRTRNKVLSTINIGTPSVTIQLPIYNEKYVAKRLVDAVCNLNYPKEQLNIMVLDDSDDDTVQLLEDVVNDYKKQGFTIKHIVEEQEKGTKQVLSNTQWKLQILNMLQSLMLILFHPHGFLKEQCLILQNQT